MRGAATGLQPMLASAACITTTLQLTCQASFCNSVRAYTGTQGAADDSAALLLLAKELTSLLGSAGQAVVHKLSQAHCQWDYLPADRSCAQAALPNRSGSYPVLVCCLSVACIQCHAPAEQKGEGLADWMSDHAASLHNIYGHIPLC